MTSNNSQSVETGTSGRTFTALVTGFGAGLAERRLLNRNLTFIPGEQECTLWQCDI